MLKDPLLHEALEFVVSFKRERLVVHEIFTHPLISSPAPFAKFLRRICVQKLRDRVKDRNRWFAHPLRLISFAVTSSEVPLTRVY